MDEGVRQGCVDYAEGLYARETETQRWVRSELERRDLPRIHVSALEGRLLALLARTVDATRLLEVGTLGGYSALWLVSLLPGHAELVTVERASEHAALAREAFERAGEAGRIDLREGDARTTLAELPGDPPFDFVFVDADKESYPEYLEHAAALMRPGGLVVADNAFWKGKVLDPGDEPGARGIVEYNRRIAEDPRFEGLILPVRDGLSVARFQG